MYYAQFEMYTQIKYMCIFLNVMWNVMKFSSYQEIAIIQRKHENT